MPLKNGTPAKINPKPKPEGFPSIKFCVPTVAISPAASNKGS